MEANSVVSLPGQQPPWHGFAAPAGGWAPSRAATHPAHHGQHFPAAAAAPLPPPPRSPAVFHTTETLVLESSPSKDGSASDSPYRYTPPEQQWQGPRLESPPPHTWGAPPTAAPQPLHWVPPPQEHTHHHQMELQRQNAELARRCQELQEQLEAVTPAAAQHGAGSPRASPSGSTHSSHKQQHTPQRQQRSPMPLGDGEVDREEVARLQRRLAAKQREAEAAAAAVAAKQAQAAQLEAELAEARATAASLSDEVAQWKGECTQRERELRALQQRVEAAEAHAGLLEDGGSALKRRNGELGTALAQRDAAIRQLEDRLRALQGSEGSKERQMEALHGGAEALRREAADLRRHNVSLQAEVQRLEPALAQAREQVASLQLLVRNLRAGAADAEVARAAGAAQRSDAAGAAWQCRTPAPAPPLHGQPPLQPAAGFSPYEPAGEPAWPVCSPPTFKPGHPQQRWQPDPYSGLPHPHYSHSIAGPQAEQEQLCPPASAWQPYQQQHQLQQRQQTAAGVRPAQQEEPLPLGAVQLNRSSALALLAPPGEAAHYSKPGHDACSTAGSNAGSPPSCGRSPRAATPAGHPQQQHGAGVSIAVGAPAAAAHTPRPSSQPVQDDEHLPRQPWTSSRGSPASSGGGACQRDAASFLAAQLGGLGLTTPGSTSSPFATEATLQDMLERTQALEHRLLALNAERNELEAEAARMPSHTNGRTLQERKRRGEVERRLEAIGKECNSVRLQLRRLGVK